jgi:hypothetical protein
MSAQLSAQPDIELRRALLPALATLHRRLLVASSLHRRSGLMWDVHRKQVSCEASRKCLAAREILHNS